MTEPEILADLTDVFRKLFKDPAIVLTPATTAEDIDGWDSFMHLSMIVAVESRFKIKMTLAEVEGLRNIGNLVAVVSRRQPKAPPSSPG